MTQDYFTDDKRDEMIRLLAVEVLPEMRETVHKIAAQVAERWAVDEHQMRVLAAELLREGSTVLRDWEAGEAEATGATTTDLAATTEVRHRPNYRRRVKHAATFRDARKVADLSRRHRPGSSR